MDTNNPATWRNRIRSIDGLPGDWAGRVDVDGNVWLYIDSLGGQGIAHRGTWDGTRVVWQGRAPYRALAAAVDRGAAFATSGSAA